MEESTQTAPLFEMLSRVINERYLMDTLLILYFRSVLCHHIIQK